MYLKGCEMFSILNFLLTVTLSFPNCSHTHSYIHTHSCIPTYFYFQIHTQLSLSLVAGLSICLSVYISLVSISPLPTPIYLQIHSNFHQNRHKAVYLHSTNRPNYTKGLIRSFQKTKTSRTSSTVSGRTTRLERNGKSW